MPASNTWIVGGISSPRLAWGPTFNGQRKRCPHCQILLLTGERPGFCCGPNGSRLNDVHPLPPLPPEYEIFMNHPQISSHSRILNLIFSFASLETTQTFPTLPAGTSFLAIQGKVYHRVRPSHQNSAVRWLLHDGFQPEDAPHSHLAAQIPVEWKSAFTNALTRLNPFVHALKNLSVVANDYPEAHLILQDSGSSAEIAAIMCYENTTQSQIRSRRLVVHKNTGSNQNIPTVSRLWEPLAYPLFFPQGTFGWGIPSIYDNLAGENQYGDAPTTQMWYYRALLLREDRFNIFGRLTNEYLVDMFTRDLDNRLSYIRNNQLRIRQEEAELMGEEEVTASENVYLPSSFLGSRRWASEQIADSLAIASKLGNPTFFVTVTCNPEWEEIKSQLRPGQTFADRPLVVVRTFKRKLTLLLNALKSMFINAGRPIYCIHSVEFQKRGLPHAHILIKFRDDCVTPDDIDSVVSAEIPSNASDAALVRKFMMHNHPSISAEPSKYCQRVEADGSRACRFKYPHSLQPTTTIDDEGRIHYRRRKSGDEMVVPHNLPLLRKFQCHINFEVANTSHIFQYLFKYIHKGQIYPSPQNFVLNSPYRTRQNPFSCPGSKQ